jgi:hypothetical protein
VHSSGGETPRTDRACAVSREEPSTMTNTSDSTGALSPQAFARQVDALIAGECARALAPLLADRPALVRAVERGDARVLWTVGGWHAADEVAHAVAPCAGGAVAVITSDALTLPTKRQPRGTIEVPEIDRARARRALQERGYVLNRGGRR